MSYGLWLSAGGLQVNQYRQEIVSNNLANVETVGFKRDLAVIHERPVESRDTAIGLRNQHKLLDQLGGGNWVRPTYTDFEQGGLVETGGELDAAIKGDGFFTVRDQNGLRYSRDGKFTLNPAGELVLAASDGLVKVLDDVGRTITIDPQGGKVHIGHDGSVNQGKATIAKLGLVEFDDPQSLRKEGKNVYQALGAKPQPATNSTVHGGYVEDSSANAISELVTMIEVTRAYELNARMISLQDQTVGQVVNSVGMVR